MPQCPRDQLGAQGPPCRKGEPFLVDGHLWDPFSSLLVCQSLHPQGKGHRAVWGGCPRNWGKHNPSMLLPPSPRWVSWLRTVVLAGEGGGHDMLPELSPRPHTWHLPIPEFSCYCCRCHAPSQHNGESTSVGKISETTCVSATESTAALDGVK